MRSDWRQVVVRFLGSAQGELNRVRTDLERPGCNDWSTIESVIFNLEQACREVRDDLNPKEDSNAK